MRQSFLGRQESVPRHSEDGERACRWDVEPFHEFVTRNGVRAARLSGIAVGQTLIWVYVLSALCSCLVGVLLTGFSGQASLGMGDDYLLPSIAVVVVGGTIITGGRGQYLGMLGGVLLLTALQTMLAGSNLDRANRAR